MTSSELPPLRQRREDIPALTEHFVAWAAQDLKRPVPTLDDGVVTPDGETIH